MRFLHTADWQIGMRAAHVGEAGGKVREARLRSARTAMKVARAERAEFVIVAGDTFEDHGVARHLIEEVAEILASALCPVYVLPGNHDYLGPGTVWEHAVWKRYPNIHVLADRNPIPIPGGALVACPLRERWSHLDPTANLPREGGGIRIGVAHGTAEGIPEEDRGHPIARAAAETARLDYLALGHFHSVSPVTDRTWYSGTHEPTKFGERESGNVLLVEIGESGAKPHVRRIATGELRWLQRDEQTSTEGQVRAWIRELEAAADPKSLIDFRVSGILFAADRADFERLGRVVRDQFLYGRLDRTRLLPAPTDDAWIQDLPPGYLREAAARLRERNDAVAARALLELYGML